MLNIRRKTIHMPTFALTVVSMRYTSHIHLAEEKFGRTKKKKKKSYMGVTEHGYMHFFNMFVLMG